MFLGSATPLYAASTILALCAVIKELFDLQIVSESQLKNGLIRFLLDIWTDSNNPFNKYVQNDDFCSSLYLAYSLFEGCPVSCAKPLAENLLEKVMAYPSQKASVPLLCVVESLVCLAPETLLQQQETVQSGFKLFAYTLATLRHNVASIQSHGPPSDDWERFAAALLTDSGDVELPARDPPEFKGIVTFLKCKHAASLVESMYVENATKSKSIPAVLKFDSVLNYLCAKGLDLPRMKFVDCPPFHILKQIYDSTSDTKTRALLDFVVSQNQVSVPADSAPLNTPERFRLSSPILYFVCSLPDATKFEILQHCPLLPRINWSTPSVYDFNFILSHTLSLTPVTNSVYCNQSLLQAFVANFDEAVKYGLNDVQRAIEIIFSQLPNIEANRFYNLLLSTLVDDKLEELFRATHDLGSLVKHLIIESSPNLEQFIVSHVELLKLFKDVSVTFTDVSLSVLLRDDSSLIDKIKSIRNSFHLNVCGKLLHLLPMADKAKKLVELLDLTFISDYSEYSQTLELLIRKMISEDDFYYQLPVLLKCTSVETHLKISNRIENLSDELFGAFEDAFERIEFCQCPF